MDIFTTVLTRVVPTPIKPENLKVKALVKNASSSALSDDVDHLEYHEQYLVKKKDSKEKQGKSKEEHANSDDKRKTEKHNSTENADLNESLDKGSQSQSAMNVSVGHTISQATKDEHQEKLKKKKLITDDYDPDDYDLDDEEHDLDLFV